MPDTPHPYSRPSATCSHAPSACGLYATATRSRQLVLHRLARLFFCQLALGQLGVVQLGPSARRPSCPPGDRSRPRPPRHHCTVAKTEEKEARTHATRIAQTPRPVWAPAPLGRLLHPASMTPARSLAPPVPLPLPLSLPLARWPVPSPRTTPTPRPRAVPRRLPITKRREVAPPLPVPRAHARRQRRLGNEGVPALADEIHLFFGGRGGAEWLGERGGVWREMGREKGREVEQGRVEAGGQAGEATQQEGGRAGRVWLGRGGDCGA